MLGGEVDLPYNQHHQGLILTQQWSGDGTLTVLAFEPAVETYHLAIKNLRNHGVPWKCWTKRISGMEPENLQKKEVGLLV